LTEKLESKCQDPNLREFARGLTLFDSAMLVVGAMIGSGIFIVPAEMARQIGSAGWLLVAWGVAGALTIAGALSYGELSAMMPQAGGMYFYLPEAYSPLWGFLYGWTLFSVIETGTIAAVAVAFARFSGVLWPPISEDKYLMAPVHISSHYAVSLSTAQLLAIAVIALLTLGNTLGLRYGKLVQNVFTVAKTVALGGLIILGILLGRNAAALHANFSHPWRPQGIDSLGPGLTAATMTGMFVAICLSQTGSLFSADSWHNIAFAAGEVKRPECNVTLAMVIGTIAVILLLTVAGVFRLRITRPDAARPYRTIGYPVVPAFYILTATAILAVLFAYRPATTWPGLLIILLGIPIYFLIGWAERIRDFQPAKSEAADLQSAE
jgi:basic amino acid/polyamine antiporter, APA family